MATRKVMGNTPGCLSIVCSPLSLWGLVAMHLPSRFDLSFNGWAVIWACGFLLSFTGAWLSSRWWLINTELIVVSFFATMTLIFAYFG